MCPGTARRPLRHLRCTLKIVSLACLVGREEERKGLGCRFAQGQMRHTSHCFYSAVFAQHCECAVKHTEEIGSFRGASGVSWSVACLEFRSECQPGVPWNSEQRRKHLLLLLRLKRIPSVANGDMTTFVTFIDASPAARCVAIGSRRREMWSNTICP